MQERSIDRLRARRGARQSSGHIERRIVERTLAYVEANYADRISLRDVARELGYSPAHLTHTFSRLTGTAVNSWIINRRIIAAQELFREGSLNVATVCDAVGFNDLCYFTRQFVRFTGTTPGRYRSAARHTCIVGNGERNRLAQGADHLASAARSMIAATSLACESMTT